MPAADFLPDDDSVILIEEHARPEALGTREIPFAEGGHAANGNGSTRDLYLERTAGFRLACYHTDGTEPLPDPPGELSEDDDLLPFPIAHGEDLTFIPGLTFNVSFGNFRGLAESLDLQGFLVAASMRAESVPESGEYDLVQQHGTLWRWDWEDAAIDGNFWRWIHLRWRLLRFDFPIEGDLPTGPTETGETTIFHWDGGAGEGARDGTPSTLTTPPELGGTLDQSFVFLQVLWPPKPPRRLVGLAAPGAPPDAPGFIPGGKSMRSDYLWRRSGPGWRGD